ncbi:cyclopentanone 1,2-monooxygenase [Mycobacterium gordonae]|uniref:Cyclopentanone 1,2-monooxygenase n=1 Tax=Mycobacterium gordonae TaxID=1778 RepID=A0A1A6BFK4_MYCGO|nr:NAD(P)/FAD-dependent oxidoreductase [Mycobacterium gordonae]MBI2698850.1 NAD(P)/FAD-dependent oxidoreductase [Mycobacterium sp.]OBS01031.1 cyclopentanone 1,2-monooxygenase [Mycobacterium gordonae]
MTTATLEELDVLVVGAGFAGLYQLERLRKLGLKIHVFESAAGLGGVWYWNCYPGARVDSWGPMYQFSDEHLWRDWNYRELYPEWSEVRAYFKYVDEKLSLSKDISFNAHVKAARFDEGLRRWRVEVLDKSTQAIKQVLPRFVLLCTGFGSKPYTPEIPGLDTFEGEAYHTARWPHRGVPLVGKRIGVIGTGASGVQVIQECGPVARQLTVFQRTPIMALPMRQRQISAEENAKDKETYAERMRLRGNTFAGFDFDFLDQGALDVSDAERQATYERLWKIGGFVPWVGNFNDIFLSPGGNRTFYDFWRDKTRTRITNPNLWEVLAPTEPPHPFGVKRPSLEQRYFEVFNQDNVNLVDLRSNPIERVTSKGIVTADGVEHELDLLVLATGFDAVTGGITAIDIRNAQGESIANSFKEGVHTALGSAVAGFPNMLSVYGPQSPSAFCNGPTCAEAQGAWVVELIDYLQKNSITRIEPTREAEQTWSAEIDQYTASTLFPRAKSWYMGANIPGKKVQMLMYPRGLPAFLGELNRSAAQGYPEFVTR